MTPSAERCRSEPPRASKTEGTRCSPPVAAAGLGGAAGRGDVSVGEDVAELVLEVVEVSGSR